MTAAVAPLGTARGMFRPRRVGHANLYVADLARSMTFYNEVCGLERTSQRPSGVGFLSNGNTHHDISLVQYPGRKNAPQRAGLNHIGVETECEAELVEDYQGAVAADVKLVFTIDHDIMRSVYCDDPEGNRVEIYADMVHDWRSMRPPHLEGQGMKRWAPGDTAPTSARNYHVQPELRRVEEAPLHPLRTTHVTLVADDYDSLYRYYTDIVGFRPLLGGPGSHFAVLAGSCGERSLSLFRADGGASARGLHHVGLEVAEQDLVGVKERLRAAGVEVEAEIDHATRRCIFIRDPDGIRLQFYANRTSPFALIEREQNDIALWLA